MKSLSDKIEITFDDILLLPNKSDFSIVEERKLTDISARVSKNIKLQVPILSSPMPGITETEMAIALGKMGGMGFLHSFQNPKKQCDQVLRVKKEGVKVAASIHNLTDGGIKHVGDLLNAGADLISIESLHAHNTQTIQFIQNLKKRYKKIEISVALVVTAEATKELIEAGVDSVRVGIGGGSHCTTRIVTAIGRPQLSAIQECYEVTRKYNIPLISDTGIQYSGDIAKALVYGADCVMIGGLFAGCEETPGNAFLHKGKKYKHAWGMCTNTASQRTHPTEKFLKAHGGIFGHIIRKIFGNKTTSSDTNGIFEEGVEGIVRTKGSIVSVIQNLEGSIRRTMWYTGSRNIQELRKRARVVFVSANTIRENMPRI